MRNDLHTLEVKPVATTNLNIGATADISELIDAALFCGTADGVAVTGVFVIEGSVKGLNEWTLIATSTNGAASRTDIPAGVTKIRCRTTTAVTAGTPVAIVSGKNSRTDR